MNELKIKMLLVKSIMDNYDDYIVGSEFSFQFGERRADLVLLCDNKLTAFEIKSARDNVSRLEYQIESYKKFFDYCFIVCETSNLREIRESTPKEIGIIVINNNGELKKIRKSSEFKRHDKKILSSTISTSKLRKLLNANGSLKSKNDLCYEVAKKTPLNVIRELSREAFFNRYAVGSKLLRQEVSSTITPDDIFTITKKSPTPLKLKR